MHRAPRPARDDGEDRTRVREDPRRRNGKLLTLQRRRALRREARRAFSTSWPAPWATPAACGCCSTRSPSGTLKLLVPEAPPRERSRHRRAGRAGSVWIGRDAARVPWTKLFGAGQRRSPLGLATPPRLLRRSAFWTTRTSTRTIHSMGTSLLGWVQAAPSSAASSPPTLGSSASPARATTSRVEGLRRGRRREGGARVAGALDRRRVRPARRALQRGAGGHHRDAGARRDPGQRRT